MLIFFLIFNIASPETKKEEQNIKHIENKMEIEKEKLVDKTKEKTKSDEKKEVDTEMENDIGKMIEFDMRRELKSKKETANKKPSHEDEEEEIYEEEEEEEVVDEDENMEENTDEDDDDESVLKVLSQYFPNEPVQIFGKEICAIILKAHYPLATYGGIPTMNCMFCYNKTNVTVELPMTVSLAELAYDPRFTCFVSYIPKMLLPDSHESTYI
jgi:hypothetical protein